MSFVLDNSVAMLWLLPQSNPKGIPYAEAALDALGSSLARVPALWWLEAANVIAKVETKGIVSEAEAQRFINLLEQLNIETDHATAAHALSDTLNLARRHGLSAYDAAYLELALRCGLPLVTLNADLAKAAAVAGLPAFQPG